MGEAYVSTRKSWREKGLAGRGSIVGSREKRSWPRPGPFGTGPDLVGCLGLIRVNGDPTKWAQMSLGLGPPKIK